jgi:WD40 repeat protein
MFSLTLRAAPVMLLAFSPLGAGAGVSKQPAVLIELPTADQKGRPRGQRATPAEAPPAAEGQKPVRTDCHGDPLPPDALVRLGTVRLRHLNPIESVRFSADGKSVIAKGIHELRIWDVASGREIVKLPKHQALRKALSPDGKTLAVLGKENEILLLDADTGKVLHRLDANHTLIFDLDFSPNSRFLASAGFGGIWRWEVSTGQVVRPGARGPSKKVLFSPDGKLLASQEEGAVRLYETTTGNVLPHPRPPFEAPFAFSPDSKTLAFVQFGELRLWDVVGGKEALTFRPGRDDDRGSYFSMAFSPDGRMLATGGQHAVRFWETVSGKELRQFQIPTGGSQALAYSPDGTKVVSGGSDRTVNIWDAATGKDLHLFQGHHGTCSRVAFSPDARILASADSGSVKLWDATTGRGLRPLPGDPEPDYPGYFAFSRDGRTLASKTWRGPLRLWQVATGKALAQFPLDQLSQPPVMAFSPDGRVLATPTLGRTNNTIDLWGSATGKKIRRLEGDAAGITALAYSPTGRLLASGSQHSRVILFDVASGKELRRMIHPGAGVVYDLALSPDGETLASKAVGDGYRLWDTATGKELRLPITDPLESPIAFSPDGALLASGGRHWPARGEEVGNAVHLWELATGQEVRRFRGHEAPVTSLVFAPDGRSLVSGSADLTALVWDATGRLEGGRLRPPRLSPKELEKLWADLAGTDAPKAHRALWALAAAPQQSLPLLQDRVRPVPPLEPAHLRRLIADLDHDRFEVREKATKELKALDERAVPALQKVLTDAPSAEVRRRAEGVLERRGGPVTSPKKLQMLRAVTVLEAVGTPEARQLLARQASGDPAALVTVRAKAALERLVGRPADMP